MPTQRSNLVKCGEFHPGPHCEKMLHQNGYWPHVRKMHVPKETLLPRVMKGNGLRLPKGSVKLTSKQEITKLLEENPNKDKVTTINVLNEELSQLKNVINHLQKEYERFEEIKLQIDRKEKEAEIIKMAIESLNRLAPKVDYTIDMEVSSNA